MQGERCRIWPHYEAEVHAGAHNEGTLLDSPRVGGIYLIDGSLTYDISAESERTKICLTTLLVDARVGGDPRPRVTDEMMRLAQSEALLSPSQRGDRLLRFLAGASTKIGQAINLDDYTSQALAWSESVDRAETAFLVDHLMKAGWIELSHGGLTIQVEGYERINELASRTDLQQAFVAMWFGDDMDAVYEDGIERGIRDAGYAPLRIDRKEDLDYIDDDIIAEINRSRFVVADFSHGESGPRGGVYYEAGHANGRGLTVIFTCRADLKDSIHFDTRQRYHIFWNSAAELRDKLTTRIIAMVGRGLRED